MPRRSCGPRRSRPRALRSTSSRVRPTRASAMPSRSRPRWTRSIPELDRPSPASAATDGLHRLESVMGTIIGVDVRDPDLAPDVLDAVFAYLHDVDRRFSTFKPDSEI